MGGKWEGNRGKQEENGGKWRPHGGAMDVNEGEWRENEENKGKLGKMRGNWST